MLTAQIIHSLVYSLLTLLTEQGMNCELRNDAQHYNEIVIAQLPFIQKLILNVIFHATVS